MSISDSSSHAVCGDTVAGDDAQHEYQQNAPVPIPPSPTLTNPDMILPVDQNEREASTPSPPFRLPSLSPLQVLYGNQVQQQQNIANELAAGDNGANINKLATPFSHGPQQQKGYPRHSSSWIMPDPSRRLSDIGEEDAAFLTPSMDSHVEGNGLEKYSNYSGSTLNASDGRAHQFENAGFHGMDRSSYGTSVETPGSVEEYPSAILSSEAERILDNAKKRLSLMEGNLTRARSTMRLTPSISPTPSSSDGSSSLGFHKPAGGLYRSISHANPKASLRRQIYSNNNSSVDVNKNRHSRVHSETTLSPHLSSETGQLSRSVSAMGSDTSSFRHDDRSFRYESTRPYLSWRASPSVSQGTSENDLQQQPVSKESTPPLVVSPEPDDCKRQISKMEEFNAAHPSHAPLTRTQSQLQVRDLRDQMKGLHIKISSLKVKQQEDSIRRRSFQTLRETNHPTAVNPWYSASMVHRDESMSPPIIAPESERLAEHTQEIPYEDEEKHVEGCEVSNVSPEKPDSPTVGDSPEQMYLEDSVDYTDGKTSMMGSIYEDAEEGEYDDSDESANQEVDGETLDELLDEPYDGQFDDDAVEPFPDNADSRPHEEREDAFDYEHFILHSALGNFSHTRARRSSDSSASSTATTRPVQNQSWSLDETVGRPRANSAASTSSAASFTTAIEGEDEEENEEDSDDGIESVLYWDRKFNDELGIERAVSRNEPHHKHTNVNANSSSTSHQTPIVGRASTSLASSLVSTVKAASGTSPDAIAKTTTPNKPGQTATNGTANGTLGINNDDTRLLERLFQSLGKVSMDLQSITSIPDYDQKTAKVLRRRLDAARRVLDGELDA